MKRNTEEERGRKRKKEEERGRKRKYKRERETENFQFESLFVIMYTHQRARHRDPDQWGTSCPLLRET